MKTEIVGRGLLARTLISALVILLLISLVSVFAFAMQSMAYATSSGDDILGRANLVSETRAFREITSTNIGPASRQPIAGFNVNHFEWQKATAPVPDCQALARTANVCRADMTLVCSKNFRTAVCIDRDLTLDPRTGRPRGNMNLSDCQQACAAQKKRLPTNNEWQVGCTGTRPEACLTYNGPHPGELFARTPGHVCQMYGAYSGPCMVSQDLVNLLPPTPAGCVSEAGVRACVGTFEQWASHHFVAGHEFRFNGGMYALSASAVDYVTPAHGDDFRHYASGCRCASDPQRAH